MKSRIKSLFCRQSFFIFIALLTASELTQALQVSPLAFDFGSVVYQKASTAQSVVITNDTSATVTLGFGGGAAGIFGGSTSCPASLAPGVSCSVNYAYTPTALGLQTGSTSLSLAGSNYAIDFKGNGISGLLVAPTTFDFGDVFVGSASISRDVTITNISNIPLVLNAAGGGAGLFGGTTSCGGITLAVGASCVFTYRFLPTSVGPQTGVSGFTVAGSSFPLSFKGNAVSPIRISGTDVDFGPVIVGATSPAQPVTVTNLSSAAVVLTSVAGGGISAPFSGSQSCAGITLAAGASCAFFYRFAPTVSGAQVGTTGFSINGVSVTMNVAGVGVTSIPDSSLRVSPRSLDYASVARGSASSSQPITITNVSSSTITLGLAGGGAGIFGGSTSCPTALTTGASCTITYAYTPTAFGVQTGSTSFTLAGISYPISFKGIGITGLVVTPTVFDFGDATLGASSLPRRMLISNTTNAAITIGLAGGGAGALFGGASDCNGVTLASGATCYIEYKYTPSAFGPQTGTSSATIGGVSYPISFVGNGISALRVSPLSFDFGRVQVGTTSPQQLVTITNTSGSTITPSYAGGGISSPFNGGQNCAGVPLAVGASCSFFYTFSPSFSGIVSGLTGISAGGGSYAFSFKGAGAVGGIVTQAGNDLNGDGRSDLLTQDAAGAITGRLMNGTSVTNSATLLAAGPQWIITHTGDFNGDGKADLLFRNSNDGSVVLYLMNGLSVTSSTTLLGGGTPWTVVQVADFNGDGKSDILWRHNDGSHAIWLMDGASLISGGAILGPGPWLAEHTGDFNGDGKSDILWRNGSDGSYAIWLMNGNVLLSGSSILGAGPWVATQTGDFNGDGKSDILWRNSSDGSIAMWLMNGTTLSGGSTLIGPGPWIPTQVGDLNGDGKADILWRNSTDGTIAAWLMNGLTLSSGASLLGAGSGWAIQKLLDFNGDGKADIVWRNADGTIALWLMNGLSLSSGVTVTGLGTAYVVPLP